MGKNARATDPDTSYAGEYHIKKSDKLQVREVYLRIWPQGLTDRELRAHCPESTIERLESWRKRRSDLAREGVLIDGGDRRAGQVVWCYRMGDQLPF
jgi:hypothetical protein